MITTDEDRATHYEWIVDHSQEETEAGLISMADFTEVELSKGSSAPTKCHPRFDTAFIALNSNGPAKSTLTLLLVLYKYRMIKIILMVSCKQTLLRLNQRKTVNREVSIFKPLCLDDWHATIKKTSQLQ